MKKYFPVCLLATALLLHGCAYLTPLVSDFNLISIEQEKAIGTEMARQVEQEKTVLAGTPAEAAVRLIGERLVLALPREDFDYEFFVVEDDTPNAFTIPGAKIYVHTGLLKFAGSEEELAGVIAHEIGHAYERHSAKALSRAYGLQTLSGMIFSQDSAAWKRLTVNVLEGGLLRKYGRDDEREADEIGYYLSRRAGYRGNGLLDFLYRLQAASGESQTPVFLRSHPPTPERIARLESLEKTRVEASLAEPG